MRIVSLSICGIISILCWTLKAQESKAFIHYYQNNKIESTISVPLKKGKIKDSKSNLWDIEIDSCNVPNKKDIIDYEVIFKPLEKTINQVSVGVDFKFTDWSANNFVFVPAIVYNGNRFDKKIMNYPPYWYNKEEWKINMPTTTIWVPSLEKYNDRGKIELTTGNASTPLMAFYASNKNLSWMVQTKQGNEYGDYGFFIEESKRKKQAIFSIMSPAVRSKRATGSGFTESGDKPINLKAGEEIVIRYRVYKQNATSLQDMYSHFMEARKDLNPFSDDYAVMPFSELWKTMNHLYQQDRWEESIQMYCITKYNPNATWNSIWQLGWVGGGQSTLPILMQGDDTEIERVIKNLNKIFTKTQASSGLYYAYGNGFQFKGFGFTEPFSNQETFVRSQGDFLYMAQLHFEQLQLLGRNIPSSWYNSLERQVNVFVNLWDKYKQVGQFVNVETGDICIGGSTAGAIVPAGLALASQTFSNKRYLEVAELLADKFYHDYVLNGYTCGGPAEILSSPDSESAFALFESFITLYEVTNSIKWLEYAKQLLPICASWVVSYDYNFPANSEMKKIDAHSKGSVWASIANKHSAPAICTWSGASLLKYFRATNDEYAIQLLKDIAHGVPQYVSHQDRIIANMEPGGSCERVNLSDWEGKENIGGNLFASCAWVEVAAMLTVTELPSIYIQKDKSKIYVLDHLIVNANRDSKNRLVLNIKNPTKYEALIKIYIEDSEEAKCSKFSMKDKSKIKQLVVKENKMTKIVL